MKKLLFICSMVCVFHLVAGCPACMRRRAEMMAKRPTLETILPKFIQKADAFDAVQINFSNGEYDDLFKALHSQYLNSKSKKEFKNLVNTRSSFRHHFGQSVLDVYANYPTQLQEIKCRRSITYQEMLENFPNTYLSPVLSFLSENQLFESLVKSLNALANHPDFQPIKRKFFLYVHLFNLQTMRQNRPDLDAAKLTCLALDYEQLRQLEEVADEEMRQHIQNVRAALPDLAKLAHWEYFLRNVIADCYKLPEAIDQKFADIQKGYMKQRSALMRKNRELLNYR